MQALVRPLAATAALDVLAVPVLAARLLGPAAPAAWLLLPSVQATALNNLLAVPVPAAPAAPVPAAPVPAAPAAPDWEVEVVPLLQEMVAAPAAPDWAAEALVEP